MRGGNRAELLLVHAASLAPMSLPRPGGQDVMQDNKTIVKRWEDEFKNRANVGITDELMSADFVHHLPFPGLPPGREGLKLVGQGIFQSFDHEHLKTEVELCLAVDDRVITRSRVRARQTGAWNGIPASNKDVEWTEITIFRLRDGKIVEMTAEGNFLGLLGQLRS